MLRIENFSYRYQSRQECTLKKINLELEQGGMLLLAGRSGCGKSTLIKAISGLLGGEGAGAASGKIFLDGEEITSWAPEKIGQLVGTVYQSPDDQLFAMNVADEVGFALENQGLPAQEIARAVAETLALVGLSGMEKHGIHQLSGGQRQRLALASILITKPRLLILDEPVSQMNPQGVQDFLQLLARLNKEEKISILMVEHRVNELYTYFPRLAVMAAGEIIYDGATRDAWDALTGREDVGVREPQNVKLCRALRLPRLAAEEEIILPLIRSHCKLIKNYKETNEKKEIGATAPRKILLSAEKICYTYPGSKLATLHEISFSLQRGEIAGLMGFNGAGKTTLLNILGGLAQADGGRLTLAGAPLEEQLGKIGYLRQEPDLMLLTDTVSEELCWKNKKLGTLELFSLLNKLQLAAYADDFPLALSKGQRLRVVLGAILAKKPELLLLDEPTTGQDEQSLQEIRRLLAHYRAQGGTILICTHDVELAAALADRIIVLRGGRIIADAPSRSVLADAGLLREGGLAPPSLLALTKKLGVPPCSTVKEVERYVRPAIVGGQR